MIMSHYNYYGFYYQMMGIKDMTFKKPMENATYGLVILSNFLNLKMNFQYYN